MRTFFRQFWTLECCQHGMFPQAKDPLVRHPVSLHVGCPCRPKHKWTGKSGTAFNNGRILSPLGIFATWHVGKLCRKHQFRRLRLSPTTIPRTPPLCIQEVFASDFPRFPVKKPCLFDGTSESRGHEAGFLVHNGVSSAEVRGARRVHMEVRLPIIFAGDANVWHPHFNLGLSRSADNVIVPFINLLIFSCGLTVRGCST